MRIDLLTIFPEFFDVLNVSLLGKARAAALVDLRVHQLRDWTHDAHHTVDDAPFGGGAGMVMKADVWGEALDDVLTPQAVLVIPSPAGEVFTQALAQELSTAPHLVFACGRYEGPDARVAEHYAQAGYTVREVSLGDYVLNGGEVAAVAMIEAITRLIPGFMGNAHSIVEESHSDGLLEYPVYTRPASWRGLDVPEVLLSGHHGRVEQWRRERAEERTRERRPDLWARLQPSTPDAPHRPGGNVAQ